MGTGANLGPQDTKTQNPVAISEEPGANWVLGAKAGHCTWPLHTPPP